MTPRFAELAKVKVIDPKQPPANGFVVGMRLRDGEWLYKVSLPDPDSPGATFDNWYRESALDYDHGK